MSYTPGPEQPDELQELESGLDAIDAMQPRPWWRRALDYPLISAQVVRQRVREYRGR